MFISELCCTILVPISYRWLLLVAYGWSPSQKSQVPISTSKYLEHQLSSISNCEYLKYQPIPISASEYFQHQPIRVVTSKYLGHQPNHMSTSEYHARRQVSHGKCEFVDLLYYHGIHRGCDGATSMYNPKRANCRRARRARLLVMLIALCANCLDMDIYIYIHIYICEKMQFVCESPKKEPMLRCARRARLLDINADHSWMA